MALIDNKQCMILPIFWFDGKFHFSLLRLFAYRFDRCCRFLIDFISCFDQISRQKTKSTISKWRQSVRREWERETQTPVTKVAFNRFLQVAFHFDQNAAAKSLSFMHFSDLIYNNISAPVTDCQPKCEQNERANEWMFVLLFLDSTEKCTEKRASR